MAEPHIVEGTVQFRPHAQPSYNDALEILAQVMADAAGQAHREGITETEQVKERMIAAAQRLTHGVS